jgi:hypothetical protein
MPKHSLGFRYFTHRYYWGVFLWISLVLLVLYFVGEAKETPWMAGAVFVLWMAGICWALWMWAVSKPRLNIGEEGVLDTTLKLGTIPWSEIVNATFNHWHGQRVICLEVRATETWRQRMKLSKERRIFESESPSLLYVVLEPGLVRAEEEQTLKLLLRKVASQNSREAQEVF